MKRLYFLTDNINVAEQVSQRLHKKGITDWHFHVMGLDKAQIVRHRLHSTTPLHELDIIRSGERGALLGIVAGILVTSYLVLFTAFGGAINWMGQLASILLFSLFGAWLGGLVGVSTENYKIRRFHQAIENGDYLLLVDVTRSQRAAVEAVIDEFPAIRKAGEDSTLIHPFGQVATQ